MADNERFQAEEKRNIYFQTQLERLTTGFNRVSLIEILISLTQKFDNSSLSVHVEFPKDKKEIDCVPRLIKSTEDFPAKQLVEDCQKYTGKGVPYLIFTTNLQNNQQLLVVTKISQYSKHSDVIWLSHRSLQKVRGRLRWKTTKATGFAIPLTELQKRASIRRDRRLQEKLARKIHSLLPYQLTHTFSKYQEWEENQIEVTALNND